MLRFAAEYETTENVIIAWPFKGSDWHNTLPAIEQCYSALADAIASQCPLIIIAQDQAHIDHISAQLKHPKTITFITIALNDTWTRDYGPITVLNNEQPELINFGFNGYGKYAHEKDAKMVSQLTQQIMFNRPIHDCDFVVEGGALETDGQGTLLCTMRSMLTRHPELSLDVLASRLQQQLGIHRVLWLKNGSLAGDDTDGHIDMLARFATPQLIVYSQCQHSEHPDFESLQSMEQELHTFKSAKHQSYELLPLPIPKLKYGTEGQPLPRSYANFLIVNQAVIVPIYQEPEDQMALAQMAKAFEHYTLVPVDANALVEQGGSIHCATINLMR